MLAVVLVSRWRSPHDGRECQHCIFARAARFNSPQAIGAGGDKHQDAARQSYEGREKDSADGFAKGSSFSIRRSRIPIKRTINARRLRLRGTAGGCGVLSLLLSVAPWRGMFADVRQSQRSRIRQLWWRRPSMAPQIYPGSLETSVVGRCATRVFRTTRGYGREVATSEGGSVS